MPYHPDTFLPSLQAEANHSPYVLTGDKFIPTAKLDSLCSQYNDTKLFRTRHESGNEFGMVCWCRIVFRSLKNRHICVK